MKSATINLPKGMLKGYSVSQFIAEGLHEIAHHKYLHFTKRIILFIFILPIIYLLGLVGTFFFVRLITSIFPPLFVTIAILVETILAFIIMFLLTANLPVYLTRSWEIQADEYSAFRIGIETYISTLESREVEEGEPSLLARFRSKIKILPTHPNIEDRINHLKKILEKKRSFLT